MTIYGLVRASFDERGRIECVRVHGIDGERNKWVGHAFELTATEVARKIAFGDVVIPFFEQTREQPARTGAKFCVVSFDDEKLGIELEEETDGCTLRDLKQLH